MANLAGDGRRQHDDVKHICPECGGATAEHIGAGLLVQLCKFCGGRGQLSDAELDAALAAEWNAAMRAAH